MRRVELVTDEIYHVFNRGTDKRVIYNDAIDYLRFRLNMVAFNTSDPIGSLWQHNYSKVDDIKVEAEPLVEIIAYCLNPNHFHIILRQLVDSGISQYMKRIQGGYTAHFNSRNERTGTLYQGRFKAVHVAVDKQLQHLSVYVNLNSHVHQLGDPIPHVRSSWYEYIGKVDNEMCKKGIILGGYDSKEDYQKFALSTLQDIIMRKGSAKLAKEGEKALRLE